MDVPARKRQKVTTACDPCRNRKIKCDGHQPVCKPCETRDKATTCTWATDSLRAPVASLDYIRRLERRIQQLEGHDKQCSQTTRSSDNTSPDGAPEHLLSQISRPRGPLTSNLSASLTSQSRLSWEELSVSNSMTSTDLGAPGLVSFLPGSDDPIQQSTRDADTIFCADDNLTRGNVLDVSGLNSSIERPVARSFMQEVEKIVMEKIGDSTSPKANNLGHCNDFFTLQNSNDESSKNDQNYTLSTREEGQKLLQQYWSYVHVIYPILNKSQTEQEYSNLWICQNSGNAHRSFLCLLNSIFAISSQQVRSAASNQEHLGAIFCKRALALLNFETCSIRAVQSHLLLALYYQSTNETHTSYLFVGHATRLVQMLVPAPIEVSENTASSKNIDEIHKAWHDCILMDREVSMLHGRLSMMDPRATATIPLPWAMGSESVHSRLGELHTVQTQQIPATDYYTCSVALYDILHDVLIEFHVNKTKQSEHFNAKDVSSLEISTSISKIQQRLAAWERGVPKYLRVGHSTPHHNTNNVPDRRAVVLHQRYLHVQLLLLTPILQCFVRFEFHNQGEPTPFGSLLSYQISLQYAIVSIKIAQEAIDTIYIREAMGTDETRDLSAWWYNVTFLYMSATVLIAGSLSPSVVAELSKSSIHDSFHKATSVLRQYTKLDTSIRRLTTVLDILFQIVPHKFAKAKKASLPVNSDVELVASKHDESGATFQYWCPIKSTRRASSLHKDTEALSNSDGKDCSSQVLWDLDLIFDTNDFTWLMEMPFHNKVLA